LPKAGHRTDSNGSVDNVGHIGFYWTSSLFYTSAHRLYFLNTSNADVHTGSRASGFSVRCLKDASVALTTPTVTPTIGTYTFSGAPQGPTTATNTGTGTSYTFSYAGVSPTVYAASASLPTAAGNYTVTVTVSANGNFTSATSVPTAFTIIASATTPTYPAGSVFCASGATAIVNVTNPATGRIWMDRNLGATQVATSSTDANAYGDLYQWGRRSDGHQCRNSSTTATLSSVDQPANGNFITISSGNRDWRSPQNNNLWQGVNGINNPCPTGYRLPTEPELDVERLSWSSNNDVGAFASVLKLPKAGHRTHGNGSVDNVGHIGFYWTSSLFHTSAHRLYFLNTSNADVHTGGRANGDSVRCLKD